MASTDATPSPVKAQALRVQFPIYLNTGKKLSAAAGVVAKIAKDQGTPATATNTVTEVSTSGMYYLDITSTEMNADTVTLSVSSTTTNAMDTDLVIPTQSAGKIKVDLETIKTQTVTAAAGVTVLASVGTAATSTAQTGDSFARIGSPTGASIAADIQTRSTFATGGSVNATQWGGSAVTGMPMPTYIQPSGFLAATFPSAVSSLTQAQITGGAYALNSSSFAFNSTLDFTLAQKAYTLNVNVSQVDSDSAAATGLRLVAHDYVAGTWSVNIGGDLTGSVGGVSAGVTLDASQGDIVFNSLTSTGAFTVNGSVNLPTNVIQVNGNGAGANGLASLGYDYDTNGILNANISGDVQGKVLGGGASSFVANGVQVGTTGDVTLAASQPNYAPAKAGDAMSLNASDVTGFPAVNVQQIGGVFTALASGTSTVTFGPNVDTSNVSTLTTTDLNGVVNDVLSGLENARIAGNELVTMIEAGTGENFRFTEPALVNTPTGGGGLTQADVRTAVGLADPDLDTQLAAILSAASGGAGGLSPETVAALEAADQILLAEAYVPSETPSVVIPAPVSSAQTNGYVTTFNGEGGTQGGVPITFQLLSTPTDGFYTHQPFTRTSAPNGLLVTLLKKASNYQAKRGNGDWVTFTTGSSTTYALPAILGTL